MTELVPLNDASKAVSVVGDIIKIAGENADTRAAGVELGKSALIVATTIRNALIPLAVINYGIEKAKRYFADNFADDLGAKLHSVPPEQIVEPKPSVAGPALQGLAFSHEESELKELYLSLLASGMDARVATRAHPAFVEVIKQLTAEEAKLLRTLLATPRVFPIVKVQASDPASGGFTSLLGHLLDARNSQTGQPSENPRLPAFVENWLRLGLVIVEYGKSVVGDTAYSWAESRPEFLRLKERHEHGGRTVSFEKGYMQRTAFGEQFAQAVGIVPDAAA